MGTTPEINIDDIDPAVYKAVVAEQTRRAANARWAVWIRRNATQRPSPGSRAANAQKAAQADFLNEGGEMRLLDINDAAERLGTTERHMRALIADRKIAYIKVGRLIRFDPKSLDEWIKANTITAVTL